nr:MAG TPA: hypothetical protein [Herelleviridae sp.]
MEHAYNTFMGNRCYLPEVRPDALYPYMPPLRV